MKRPDPDKIYNAIRCPYCGRWITVKLETKYITFYNEVNWDCKGGFYYIANRGHDLSGCKYKIRKGGIK